MTLGAETHLWLAAEPVHEDHASWAVLGDDERARAAGYLLERDRRLYVFAHGFLRRTLARYLDHVTAEEVRFIVGAHGRPELASEPANGHVRSLRFSLTHCAGLAACVVTEHDDCGVDAEPADRAIDTEDLPRVVLADDELMAFKAAGSEQGRRRCLLRLWTLKEAYVKARGVGLSLPLKDIRFSDVDERVRCTFGKRLQDRPERWQFWTGQCDDTGHLWAVAQRSRGKAKTLIVRRA